MSIWGSTYSEGWEVGCLSERVRGPDRQVSLEVYDAADGHTASNSFTAAKAREIAAALLAAADEAEAS